MPASPPSLSVDWYFDVVSPFAYLQLKAHMPRLRAAVEIAPKPMVLGAVLQHWGQKGPAEIAPKRLHTYRLAQHRAGVLGVPLRFPPAHPFNPIPALRAIVAGGGDWATVETVLDLVWCDGLDPSGPAGLATMAKALALPDLAERIAADPVKQTLRANSDAAVAASVFGVPAFVMNGAIFWGEDATDLFAAVLADPAFFTAPEMARLETIEVGIARK